MKFNNVQRYHLNSIIALANRNVNNANNHITTNNNRLAVAIAEALLSENEAIQEAAIEKLLSHLPRDRYNFSFLPQPQAADAKYALALHYLGLFYEAKYNNSNSRSDSDIKLALDCFEKAASQRYRPSVVHLAVLYHEGKAVTQNVKKAFEYFLIAAKQGHPTSQYWVGQSLCKGDVQSKNITQGLEFMTAAANSGLTDAQFKLAEAYWHGKLFGNIIPQDKKNAFTWYLKAAEAGHIVASFFIAKICAEGYQCENSFEVFIRNLENTLERKYKPAFDWLAKMEQKNNLFVIFYQFIDTLILRSKIAPPVNMVQPFNPSYTSIVQFMAQFNASMQYLMKIHSQNVQNLFEFTIKKLKEHWGYNVLFDTALRLGNQAVVEYFLDCKLATAEDCCGGNALSIAIEKQQVSLSTYLIRKFPELINKQNGSGRTPLHYAAITNFNAGILLLIQHGAIYNITDMGGKTAEELVPRSHPFIMGQNIGQNHNQESRKTLMRLRSIFVCINDGATLVLLPVDEFINYFYAKDTSGHTAAHLVVMNVEKGHNAELLQKIITNGKIDLSITNSENISVWTLIEQSNKLTAETVISAGILKIKQCIHQFETMVYHTNDHLNSARNEVTHILQCIIPRLKLDINAFLPLQHYILELGMLLGNPKSKFFMPKQVYDLYQEYLINPSEMEHLTPFQKGHLSLSEFFMAGFLKLKSYSLDLEEISEVISDDAPMEDVQESDFDSKQGKETSESFAMKKDTKQVKDKIIESDKERERDLRQLATLHHAILADQHNQENFAKILAEFCLGGKQSMAGLPDAVSQYAPLIISKKNVMVNVLCHLKGTTQQVDQLKQEKDKKDKEFKLLQEINAAQTREIQLLNAKMNQSANQMHSFQGQVSQKQNAVLFQQSLQQLTQFSDLQSMEDDSDLSNKSTLSGSSNHSNSLPSFPSNLSLLRLQNNIVKKRNHHEAALDGTSTEDEKVQEQQALEDDMDDMMDNNPTHFRDNNNANSQVTDSLSSDMPQKKKAKHQNSQST